MGIAEDLEACEALARALMSVVREASEFLVARKGFPQSWLFHHRWFKGKTNGGKLPDGRKILFETVSGRSTAVVADAQRKYTPPRKDKKIKLDDEGSGAVKRSKKSKYFA